MKKNKVLDFSYKYGAIFVIIAVIIFFSIVNPNFLTYDNITDILRYISIVTLVAIGVTFSLIVDGFDLSVGSTVSLTTVVTASLMVWYQLPLPLVILIPILLGAIVGLVNAWLIVKIRIPDLLATLSMLYIVAGLHKTYTQGFSIYNNMPMPDGSTAQGILGEGFLWIGQGKLLGVPVPVIIMLVAVVAVHVFLAYTRGGRLLYITGGNQEAARLSGISIYKVRTVAYVLSGVFAALAGIIFTARVGSGQVDAGSPLLMEAVAAAFVGFSVFGAGKPNVIGTFLGAFLIGILVNGLTMLNLPYYAFDIIKGAVLVFALSMTYLHMHRRKS
ncbi:ABC transporter permease [Aneurinibacillus aneurinilyticus]|uniref:ABC transporter permease n=2 Tax=Aneurinibacillus aneurinilyticus TaxID=1391 RepID=A0A848CY21_ANEAE|nr:ABC transporter permease [Aneurinibacillus aneurinilyticus]ERI07770.1 putative ribose ABC transporter permease protein [Aneurinibacillus aneurinilyticus ATCC 12856]MCI1694461.1 ABC transporter permease [Aneurinibacillus aneurinilyticus]MED0671132.1 ABC transporter permease [Aneurinibacillus aneurinilyticus]MED0707004.1 ABC transporter permease [Aneurinibacillus aneurinilyticus]MED0724430.1 ABC transporter permease [Aneurinibacillus aneurinilyticus]